MTELRSTCDCQRLARILWSQPLGPESRPVLLVCGYWPRPRCTFRQGIPESAVTVIPSEKSP